MSGAPIQGIAGSARDSGQWFTRRSFIRQRNLLSIVHREERIVFPTQIKAVKKGERAESYGLARKSLHIWRGLLLLHCAALSIDTV